VQSFSRQSQTQLYTELSWGCDKIADIKFELVSGGGVGSFTCQTNVRLSSVGVVTFLSLALPAQLDALLSLKTIIIELSNLPVSPLENTEESKFLKLQVLI